MKTNARLRNFLWQGKHSAPASLVLNQVAAGVATRMAVLYLLATRNDGVRA